MVPARQRLIVALDVCSSSEAQKLVGTLGESVQIYKVGMQLYTAEGPQVVRDLIASGRDVFLDLKYHDIPNTVGAAVTEASQLGVRMLTVHAAGGSKMLRAAVEAAKGALQVLAVTILTSMEAADLNEIGVPGQIVDQVTNLASIALESGCAGLVSSARELPALRRKFGSDFVAVIPGVRPTGSARGDQARVVTPAEAISAGATHIVVGRPITSAPDPVAAVESILAETAAIPVA
jgi:orotidine-5'-phosphate decarboxylase